MHSQVSEPAREAAKARRWGVWAAAAAVAAVLFLQLLDPIGDPDFFWHLASGSWILENRALPAADPFATSSPAVLDSTQRFILRAYWGLQVQLALLFRLGGMKAIFFLRLLPVALLVGALIRRRSGDPYVFIGFLLMLLVILSAYHTERPQTWSFAFWALLLLLLPWRAGGRHRDYPVRHVILVPLLMLCWSNFHGGFILGQTALAVTLALEGVRFLHPALAPMAPRDFARFSAAALGGMLLALANPATWHAWEAVGFFRGGPALEAASNMEYLSSPAFYRLFGDSRIIVFWTLLALTAAGILLCRRASDLAEAVLLAGTGLLAFQGIRYIIFFAILAVPAAARTWSAAPGARRLRFAVLAAGLALSGSYAWEMRHYPQRASHGIWVDESSFPRAAADFIEAENLSGRMYNPVDWGGYLMWRLWPGRKVLIDGRGLNPRAVVFDRAILMNTEIRSEAHLWKRSFEANHITYAVLPWRRFGKPPALLRLLLDDPDWVPVFLGGEAVIFVRDIPENAGVIARRRLSRGELLQSVSGSIRTTPADAEVGRPP